MICLVLLTSLIAVGGDGEAPFRAVPIDPRFESYLRANPLLMEVPGAKAIRLDNGNQVVLAVASTVLKANPADVVFHDRLVPCVGHKARRCACVTSPRESPWGAA